jgi:4'-phosphopantetheinyl transferase
VDPGEATFDLPDAEVHVWRVDLAAPVGSEALEALSDDERERADRFRFDVHRRRFVRARAALRSILARYTGSDPGALAFEYGEHGKPSLAGEGPAFNLSHSEDVALCAVASGRGLGVDVEWAARPVEHLTLAERFFAPGEVAVLRTVPPEHLPAAFFACWTRKEAYVKATGRGLSLPLHGFEVSLEPVPEPSLRVLGDPEETARWGLRALDAGHGFTAALVAERPPFSVRVRPWPQGAALDER